MTILLYFYKN